MQHKYKNLAPLVWLLVLCGSFSSWKLPTVRAQSFASTLRPCWYDVEGQRLAGWPLLIQTDIEVNKIDSSGIVNVRTIVRSFNASKGERVQDPSTRVEIIDWTLEQAVFSEAVLCLPQSLCSTLSIEISYKEGSFPEIGGNYYSSKYFWSVYLRDLNNPLSLRGAYIVNDRTEALVASLGDCARACGPNESLLEIETQSTVPPTYPSYSDWLLRSQPRGSDSFDDDNVTAAEQSEILEWRCPTVPQSNADNEDMSNVMPDLCYWGHDDYYFALDSICVPSDECYTLTFFHQQRQLENPWSFVLRYVRVVFDNVQIMERTLSRFETLFFGKDYICNNPCLQQDGGIFLDRGFGNVVNHNEPTVLNPEDELGDLSLLEVYVYQPPVLDETSLSFRRADSSWLVTDSRQTLILSNSGSAEDTNSSSASSASIELLDYRYQCVPTNECYLFRLQSENDRVPYTSQVALDHDVFLSFDLPEIQDLENHARYKGDSMWNNLSYIGDQALWVGTTCSNEEVCGNNMATSSLKISASPSFGYQTIYSKFTGPLATEVTGRTLHIEADGGDSYMVWDCVSAEEQRDACPVLALDVVYFEEQYFEVFFNEELLSPINCGEFKNGAIKFAYPLYGNDRDCSKVCVPFIEQTLPYWIAGLCLLLFIGAVLGCYWYKGFLRAKANKDNNASETGESAPVAMPITVELSVMDSESNATSTADVPVETSQLDIADLAQAALHSDTVAEHETVTPHVLESSNDDEIDDDEVSNTPNLTRTASVAIDDPDDWA